MTFAALIFNIVVCFALPVAGFVLLARRSRRYAALFGLGIAGFLVSQVLTRIPLLSLLQQTPSFIVFSATSPWLYALMLAASAALFEETARFVFLRPQRKRGFDVRLAVAYGLGHGGLEAALVGMSSVVLLTRPEFGGADASAAWAGVERLGAMAFHVAMSITVYAAIMRRSALLFACALAAHTVCDLAAVLPFFSGVSIAAYETAFVVCSFAILAATLFFAREKHVRIECANDSADRVS